VEAEATGEYLTLIVKYTNKNRKAKPFGLVQTHEAARVALQRCPILRHGKDHLQCFLKMSITNKPRIILKWSKKDE